MNTQNTLDQSLQNTQSLLSDFLNSNDITESLLNTFGDNFDTDRGISLLESLANGEITVPIEIIDRLAINNANGAFSRGNSRIAPTIYLSTELIESGDVNAITKTLLEETGHYLDSQINSSDTPGDEGAIFASLVLGEEIDRDQLALLKAEDDTAIVALDGETRTIEQDGTTIYVNANASGNENGTSWANAYTDLQDALAAATPGDEVWVADGTYKPTTDADTRFSFQIPTGVAVYGGFAGGETALFERDWLNNPTILSGDIGQEGVPTDNSGNVVNISNTTVTTFLDGFTISEGNTTGVGGGIYASRANAILRNLIVRDNNAGNGGGLYLYGGTPTLTNVTFIDNFASGVGGAINSNGGDFIAENVVFISNEAQSGGAILTNNVEYNITNSTFYNNQAAEGSAIFGGSPIVENSIFWNNLAAEEDSQIVTQGEVKNSIVEGGYTGTGTNIIDADPLFLDPENNDLRLQANSPGVDAGNNDVVNSTRDVLNNPRIFNTTVDLGAYEYSLLMSIDNATIVEGDSDNTNLQFNVTLLDSLGEASTEEVTVNYATVDDTAVAGEDYTPVEGTVTFNAGDTSQTISIPITGDGVIETDETLIVELSNISSNAVIVDERAAGIITNDDTPRQISIADATLEEADEGDKPIEFTVSLDEAATEKITVNYNVIEDTATAGEDYTSIEGTLTFAPEDKEKTVAVLVQNDTNFEPDETFFVQLSNPSDNAEIADDRATGTITNDDKDAPPPVALAQNINRFQNKDIPGTYIFVGENESENIRDNFTNFEEEGIAFKVSFEQADDLIPLYRFQSIRNPGTYVFVGEEERQNINENFSNDFNEEGLAFYVYGVGEEKGTTFYRFQNEDKPGTYLFAGPEERENILDNFPNFTEEGPAFEVGI